MDYEYTNGGVGKYRVFYHRGFTHHRLHSSTEVFYRKGAKGAEVFTTETRSLSAQFKLKAIGKVNSTSTGLPFWVPGLLYLNNDTTLIASAFKRGCAPFTT